MKKFVEPCAVRKSESGRVLALPLSTLVPG
jgi:hypothetical protein